jgi:hypothetical protein
MRWRLRWVLPLKPQDDAVAERHAPTGGRRGCFASGAYTTGSFTLETLWATLSPWATSWEVAPLTNRVQSSARGLPQLPVGVSRSITHGGRRMRGMESTASTCGSPPCINRLLSAVGTLTG